MRIGDVVSFKAKTQPNSKPGQVRVTRLESLSSYAIKIIFSDNVTMGINFEPNHLINQIILFDSSRRGEPIGLLTYANEKYVYSEKNEKARLMDRMSMAAEGFEGLVHDNDLVAIARSLKQICSKFQSGRS